MAKKPLDERAAEGPVADLPTNNPVSEATGGKVVVVPEELIEALKAWRDGRLSTGDESTLKGVLTTLVCGNPELPPSHKPFTPVPRASKS